MRPSDFIIFLLSEVSVKSREGHHQTSLLITLLGSRLREEESDRDAPQVSLLGATHHGKEFSRSIIDERKVPKQLIAAELDSMELRIASYRHRWWSGPFGTDPRTEFTGSAFVINKNNGQIYTWNLIETSSDNNCNIPRTKIHYY
jgi:hypothetical protein